MPGLSGSIFAIILGLYEKGLYAVANFTKAPVVHSKFLLPIAIGGGIGVLAGARLVLSLTSLFPAFTYLFFCGLVIGSAPLILRKTQQLPFKPAYLLCSAAAFFVMLVILNANIEGTHTTIYRIGSFFDFFNLALAGLIAVPLMVVPGISSSIVIIVLGHFDTIYNALGETVTMLQHIITAQWELAGQSFATVLVLVPFVVGAIIGTVTVAKITTYLLARYEVIIYYFVAGALLGSIGILIDMGVVGNIPHSFGDIAIFAIIGLLCVGAGVFCTILLGYKDGLDRN